MLVVLEFQNLPQDSCPSLQIPCVISAPQNIHTWVWIGLIHMKAIPLRLFYLTRWNNFIDVIKVPKLWLWAHWKIILGGPDLIRRASKRTGLEREDSRVKDSPLALVQGTAVWLGVQGGRGQQAASRGWEWSLDLESATMWEPQSHSHMEMTPNIEKQIFP